MVEPEVDQRLLELPPTLGRTDEPRSDQLGAHLARQLERLDDAGELGPRASGLLPSSWMPLASATFFARG